MHSNKIIFNRKLIKTRRNKVAKNLYKYDFLYKECANRILSRIRELELSKLENILDLGCHTGQLTDLIKKENFAKKIINSDISKEMLKNSNAKYPIALDEEHLPFKNNTFDLVVSNLSLHWVNDFISTLKQIHCTLKQNGVLIASIFGGDTLWELRKSILLAETELTCKSCSRVSPFIEIKTLGNLLQHAGFKMVVTDIETISVTYLDLLSLVKDLRAMGENCALLEKKQFLNKKVFDRSSDIYKNKFNDGNNHIVATFDILTMTGNK